MALLEGTFFLNDHESGFLIGKGYKIKRKFSVMRPSVLPSKPVCYLIEMFLIEAFNHYRNSYDEVLIKKFKSRSTYRKSNNQVV